MNFGIWGDKNCEFFSSQSSLLLLFFYLFYVFMCVFSFGGWLLGSNCLFGVTNP